MLLRIEEKQLLCKSHAKIIEPIVILLRYKQKQAIIYVEVTHLLRQ